MFDQLTEREFLEYIKIDVAIIVANDNELEIGKQYLLPFSSKDSQYEVVSNSLTYYCGLLGSFATCIVKTNNQGSIRDGASSDTVEEVINFLGKNIIIISAGIAFGLKKDTQKFGDLLVSNTFK